MLVSVNIQIALKCHCGNPSRMVENGDDHYHCMDCGLELSLTAWAGQGLVVCAPSADAAIEYLRLTGVNVTKEAFVSEWVVAKCSETIPAVWREKELLRDF